MSTRSRHSRNSSETMRTSPGCAAAATPIRTTSGGNARHEDSLTPLTARLLLNRRHHHRPHPALPLPVRQLGTEPHPLDHHPDPARRHAPRHRREHRLLHPPGRPPHRPHRPRRRDRSRPALPRRPHPGAGRGRGRQRPRRPGGGLRPARPPHPLPARPRQPGQHHHRRPQQPGPLGVRNRRPAASRPAHERRTRERPHHQDRRGGRRSRDHRRSGPAPAPAAPRCRAGHRGQPATAAQAGPHRRRRPGTLLACGFHPYLPANDYRAGSYPKALRRPSSPVRIHPPYDRLRDPSDLVLSRTDADHLP